MALLHVFAAWRNALTDVYRNRVRLLKGSLLLKAVDMRSVSCAFSLWRGIRENYRQQLRVGVFISSIVNKATRLMVAAFLHEWKALARFNVRHRIQLHKQSMRMQHKLLGNCVVEWSHNALCKQKHEVREETHHVLVKMRVLHSLFRLLQIAKRMRVRSKFWKQMTGWKLWTDFIREQQRLRLQLPYHAGEVVPNGGEMRQYRLLDAFFYMKTRELLGRTLAIWVALVDVRYRRRHFRGILSLRSRQRFGVAMIGRWMQHTRWKRSGRERINLLVCKHNGKWIQRTLEAWSRWVYFQRLVRRLKFKLKTRRRSRALQEFIWAWALISHRRRLLTMGLHIVQRNFEKFLKKKCLQILKRVRRTNRTLEFAETIDFAYFKPRESCDPHVRCKLWLAATKSPEYLSAGVLARWKLTSKTTPTSLMRFGFACWISQTIALRPLNSLAQGLYLRRFAEKAPTLIGNHEWRTVWKACRLWATNSRRLSRQKDIISGFCLKVLMRETVRVLFAWRSLVDSEIAFRTRISSAANMMLVRQAYNMRLTFMHWLLHCKEQGYQDVMMREIEDQTKRSILLDTLATWKRTVSGNKHMNSLSIRLMSRKRRAIRFNGFWKWKDYVRAVRRILHAIQRKQMQSRLMAYVALLNYAGRKRRDKTVIDRIRLTKRHMVFGQWSKLASDRLAFRKIIGAKALQRSSQRQVRHVAGVWIWQVQLAVTRRSRLTWALCKLRIRVLANFSLAWFEKTLATNAVRSLRSRIRRKSEYNIREAAFFDLVAATVRQRRSNVLRSHISAVNGIRALRAWRWQVQETWRLTLAATKVRYHRNLLLLSQLFECWSHVLTPAEDSPEEEKVAVSLSFEQDFDNTIIDEESRKKFEEKVAAHVSCTLKVPANKIQFLCHQRGSVITEILVPGDPESSRSANLLAKKLARTTEEGVVAQTRRTAESPQKGRLKLKGAVVHGKMPASVHQALMRSAQSLPTVDQHVIERRLLHVAIITHKMQLSRLRRGVFLQWRDFAKDAHQKSKRLKVLVYRIKHYCLVKAHEEWADYASMQKRKRFKSKSLLLKMKNMKLSIAFHEWIESVSLEKQKRSRVRSIILKMMGRRAAGALLSWKENVKELKQKKNRAHRAVQRLRNRQLVFGFDKWSSMTKEIKGLKTRSMRIIHRLKNSCLVNCMELWQENTREQITMKAKSARIIHRLKNSCLVNCFERWQEFVVSEQQLKVKAVRVVQRLINSALVHCFEIWVDVVTGELVLKQKMAKVLGKLLNATLSLGFDTWVSAVEESKRQRTLMRTLVFRIRNRSVSLCFYSWNNFMIDLESRRDLIAKLSYKVMFRIFRRWQRSAFMYWQKHVETAKQSRTKSKKIVLRMLHSGIAAAFDRWSKSIKEQKRLRRSAQKVVSRFKNKAATAAFDLWKHNVLSVKQAVRELGQNARFFYAVVKVLEGRRNTTLKWKSIRVWQQRALDTKEFQLMCDKMGGLVDARVNKKFLNEWRKVARNSVLCLNAIDRRSEWMQGRLMEAAVGEWHSLTFLESRRQQIVGLLCSRLPRKVISAWTHSFAWRRCVDGRSARISRSCAAKHKRIFQLSVLTEWQLNAKWRRRVKVLSKFWIFKFLFKWVHYRAKYRFHRERSVHAPEHEAFIAQLKHHVRATPDRVARAYDFASRLLGDTALLAQKESTNVIKAQALFSRAWLLVHRHDLHDLRPALQEIDAKVQTMSLELQALTDVGLTIGSRLRVSWSIKVKKELSPERAPGKNDARENWVDIWWGCTVLSRAMHKNKERDAQGNALWNVIYGECDTPDVL